MRRPVAKAGQAMLIADLVPMIGDPMIAAPMIAARVRREILPRARKVTTVDPGQLAAAKAKPMATDPGQRLARLSATLHLHRVTGRAPADRRGQAVAPWHHRRRKSPRRPAPHRHVRASVVRLAPLMMMTERGVAADQARKRQPTPPRPCRG